MRRGLVIGAAVGLVAVATAAGVRALDGPAEQGRSETAGGATSTTAPPTEEEAALARRAFAGAARALEQAGSFTYEGVVTSSAAGPSAPWPGPAGEAIAVAGQVSLPGRSTERASGAAGVTDTVVSGRGVWQRASADEVGIESSPWALVGQGVPALGLAGLPEWLSQSVDAVPVGGPPDGGLTVAAVVSDRRAGAAGAAAPLGGGLIDVTVDEAGAPRHVTVRFPADEPVLVMDLDISGFGSPMDIAPPDGVELGATPTFGAEELAAQGFAEPLQLTELPPGWALADAEVTGLTMDGSCSMLVLTYDNVVDPEASLGLEVSNEGCAVHEALQVGQRLGGRWRGDLMTYADDFGGFVAATDGTSRIGLASTLGPDDLVPFVLSLGPFDPLAQPSLTVGDTVPVLGAPATDGD